MERMVCPQKEKRLTRKIFGAIMKKIQKRRTHREEICSRHDEHDGNVHVPHVHALLRLFPDVLSCELILDRLTGWKYKRSNRKLSGFLFFCKYTERDSSYEYSKTLDYDQIPSRTNVRGRVLYDRKTN